VQKPADFSASMLLAPAQNARARTPGKFLLLAQRVDRRSCRALTARIHSFFLFCVRTCGDCARIGRCYASAIYTVAYMSPICSEGEISRVLSPRIRKGLIRSRSVPRSETTQNHHVVVSLLPFLSRTTWVPIILLSCTFDCCLRSCLDCMGIRGA
jgi:hypothetical protein